MENDDRLLANVVSSQIELHRQYGGVVPELASRRHLEDIYPVVEEALRQAGIPLERIDGLAVTQGPGLIGSLLVGLSFAKALALVKEIPYVGVDHMEGHLFSVFLGQEKPTFPFVALIASGGHSSLFHVTDHSRYELIGRTRDDAAGEAFDKVAKILGLPYPGGPIISALAATGDRRAVPFPRAWLAPDSLDFSFSGLKTAVATYLSHKQKPMTENDQGIADLCASFQEAVVEVLAGKTVRAARRCNVATIVLAGGVAANPRLRELLRKLGGENGLRVCMPPRQFCTDNAAMIALAGYYRFHRAMTGTFDMDVYSRSPLSPRR
ncbi:MAG: tRNA (adenosine(37)-N6)-threonylcarbamoyltransferase complex transferase subunit TsaD [Thermodesulfobacteriota bacterium]